MQSAEAMSAEQIREFLNGSQAIEFTGQSRTEKYAWAEQTLVSQQYLTQHKRQRGIVRAEL
jgi:hypothetical protein